MTGNLPRRTFLQQLALGGPLASAVLASDTAAQGAECKAHRRSGASKKRFVPGGEPEPAHTLPELPYKFNALEPAIDEQTMRIHHGKHHAGYVKKFNKALAGRAGLAAKPIEDLLAGLRRLSPELRTATRRNGAGHYNHALFWASMAPPDQGGAGEPQGKLAEAIARDLGGFQAFKAAFSKAAATQFASGWAWLAVGSDGKLFVSATPNHDNPLMTGIVDKTGAPILVLDVWEHAYYLKYQNRRADYIAAWWNVVNWRIVAERFAGTKRTPQTG